jgi:hypothetical protein
VGVHDSIFESLWDATLSEIQNGTPVWEVYLDTPNFYSGESAEVRAAAAEAVLRQLRRDGWATLIRRRWEAASFAPGAALSDAEVETLLEHARSWYEGLSEETPLPDELNVFLSPTRKWLEWSRTAFG